MAALFIRPKGDYRAYFCTTWENADIIDQISSGLCGGGPPRTMKVNAYLVSIPNQGLENQAWTVDRLKTKTPTVHARYGHIATSGERHSTNLTIDTSRGSLEFEPTMGVDDRLYDARVDFSQQSKETQQSKENVATNINLHTTYTGTIGAPFIINCGTQGTKQREYFLIIHTEKIDIPLWSFGIKPLAKLDKIDGIYAFGNVNRNNAAQATKPHLVTRRYRTPSSFLNHFKTYLENAQVVSRPMQVQGADSSQPTSGNIIWDLTPQIRSLRLPFGVDEFIHYDSTQHHLIFHTTKTNLRNCQHILDQIITSYDHILTSIEIVEVNCTGITPTRWTADEVQNRNPTRLSSHSLTCRNMEKAATSSRITSATDQNQDKTTRYQYDIETKPAIGVHTKNIAARTFVYLTGLGPDKTELNLSHYTITKDGEAMYKELGHPNKTNRTLLLILNTQITSADGHFFRDRFKPIN